VAARDAGSAAAAFAGFWVFLGTDTVLARHYLPGALSGFYAAAATAARAVLFLPGAIALVAFPRFAESEGRSPGSRAALAHAVVVVGLLGTGAALAVIALPRLFITVLFGGAFGASTGVVGVLALAAAAMGLVSVLVHYLLACRSRLAFAVWPGVAVMALAIPVLHSSLAAVGEVTLACSLGVLILVAVGARAKGREGVGAATEGSRQLWEPADPEIDLTVVVPFYNPGARFRPNIEKLIDVLHHEDVTFEVIAVSDGSTDGSEATLEGVQGDVLRCVVSDTNTGKGSALRTGLAMARGRYVGFIDSDGDLDPTLLVPFLGLMRLYDPDIILGSKRHPLSVVDYPGLRRLYSWGYQQLIRALFRLNVRDTQTGIKLVRREVLARALPVMVEKRFAFDLELFVVANHLGYHRFFEAPVRIGERFSSTISLRAVRGMLLDTLAIFYRLHLLRFYDRKVDPLPRLAAAGPPAGPPPPPSPDPEVVNG